MLFYGILNKKRRLGMEFVTLLVTVRIRCTNPYAGVIQDLLAD